MCSVLWTNVLYASKSGPGFVTTASAIVQLMQWSNSTINVQSTTTIIADTAARSLCRYAGAGLFDSTQSIEPQQVIADYSIDRLLEVKAYQHSMLAAVGLVSLRIEQLLGSAQDIEGVIDCNNVLHIVQTRPQV